MTSKSDNAATDEVRIPATEASRSFSSVLDEVETGKRFIIVRHGREVGTIAPLVSQGRRASACLQILSGRPPVLLDESFGDDLLDILAGEPPEDRPAWAS